MQVEARGLIYDATHKPEAEKIAFFTSLARLKSGDLLCGFQVGPTKQSVQGNLRFCRSRDGGMTWRESPYRFDTSYKGVPGSLAAGSIAEIEPGKLLLATTWFDRSDPQRPLFDPVTEGVLHCKQLVAWSTDAGETWGPWSEIPTQGLTGCALCGPFVEWPDGTLGHVFESYKEFDDPKPGRHGAWMLISRDRGKTFPELYLVAQHPEHKVYYWDQRLCMGKGPGEFIGMFWTHDLELKKDLNVHFRKGSISDKDKSKIVVTDTGIPGQIAAPLLLDDGRILSFVVYRGRPGNLRLWQSGDGGNTWPEKASLMVHNHDERAMLTQGLENIDFKQYWEDMGKWTYGHPAIHALDKDHVLCAFYAGNPERMSIHWARVNVKE